MTTILTTLSGFASAHALAQTNDQESEETYTLEDDLEIRTKISTGFDYSKGDYGDTIDTEVWYFPISARADIGDNWSLGLTVPYLIISGPGTVVGGEGLTVVNATRTVKTTEEGLGDISASLTYTFEFEENDTYLDLGGKIKFPTADEDKGLGTGETDYTVNLDLTKMFDQAYVFAGVGRKFYGTNEDLDLDDVWMYNIGAGYQFTSDIGAGVSYDYREAAGSGDDSSDATIYLTYKLTDDVSLQTYGVVGFSDGSPDGGIGSQISYKFPPL